jgi:GH24 family phage-related lysozyme (muramidase)
VDRYFYPAILLASVSSFGYLTVAIAKEQVSLEYSNNNISNLNNDLDSIDRRLNISTTSIDGYGSPSTFQNDTHQELQAITQKPLVSAVLEGKLAEVEPLETEAAPKPVAVSEKTLKIVKEFEGFRSSAYLDTDGTPVIGYGQSKINGRKVRLGDRISPSVANAALEKDLQVIQTEILSTVKVNLNEHQLGALTSLAFNTGVHAITKSTLVRELNQQNYLRAANEFTRWNKANIRGKLIRMEGLSRRRHKERELFLTPVASSLIANK